MAKENRSPFGELVFYHRNRLDLTQMEVANRTHTASKGEIEGATITDRTVSAYEREVNDPARWSAPRSSTLAKLAEVFGLEPGTPDHDAFVEAARHVRQMKRQHSEGRTDPPAQPAIGESEPERAFVPDGRESHLERLRKAVGDAVAGSPGVLFVQADAGTGKTWLIREACRQAVQRHPELAAIWSGCTRQAGIVESHEPLRQILRLMVGDLDMVGPWQRLSDANTSRLINRVPLAARAIVSDGPGFLSRVLSDERLWTDNLAGTLDPEWQQVAEAAIQGVASPDPSGMNLCEQFYRVLSRYTEAGPVILVLEDLHWSDNATMLALSHLIHSLHAHPLPVLIVGSFRPGELGPAESGEPHPLLPVLREPPRLFRDPILDLSTAVGGVAGRAFVDAMIARSDHTYPDDIADLVFEQTGGLPLFATGVLRMYEEDDPDGVDDHEVATGRRGDVPIRIPAEIEMLFAEQLERLPSQLQDFLAIASVQGSVFSAETMMQVLALSRPQLIEMIDPLLEHRHRLLVSGGTSTVAGETVHTYQFAHALFRDYLYWRMTDLERAQHHAVTADALLDLYGEEPHEASEAIAFHLARANDRTRAARACVTAGIHAMHTRDFERAVGHFERVGELRVRRSDPDTFIMAIVGLGNCARGLGKPQEARETLEKALDLAMQHELPEVQAHAMEALGILDFDAGDMRAGVDRLESVIEVWLDTGAEDDAARTMANLSNSLYGLGRYDDAMALAQRGSALAIRLGGGRRWVSARNAEAICWLDLGFYEEANTILQRCIDVCVEINDVHRENLCWYNISLCAIERGRWDSAQDAVERVLTADPASQIRLVAAGEFNAGVIAEGRNDVEAARAHYERSRSIREQAEQEALVLDSLAGLLRVAMAGDDRERMSALRADLSRRIEDRGLVGVEHVGRLFVTLAESSLALDDDLAARAYVRQAVAFLTDRADRLSEPAHQRSYLGNVPSHRRIFELAASMGIS